MTYKIHEEDKFGLVFRIADLLQGIPQEETEEIINEAKKLFLSREFNDDGYARNAEPDDPYWYEHRLIKTANEYIIAGDPLSAYSSCLTEINHGHSGFVDQVIRVYKRPRNEDEKNVSKEIRQMIIDIANALLDLDPVSVEKSHGNDVWGGLFKIQRCLNLLGGNIPLELIVRFKEFLSDYETHKGDSRDLFDIKKALNRRFGH